MNKGYHLVRFLLLLLIVLSLFVFVYWFFAKINILDVYYYRIDVFGNNEKVDFPITILSDVTLQAKYEIQKFSGSPVCV